MAIVTNREGFEVDTETGLVVGPRKIVLTAPVLKGTNKEWEFDHYPDYFGALDGRYHLRNSGWRADESMNRIRRMVRLIKFGIQVSFPDFNLKNRQFNRAVYVARVARKAIPEVFPDGFWNVNHLAAAVGVYMATREEQRIKPHIFKERTRGIFRFDKRSMSKVLLAISKLVNFKPDYSWRKRAIKLREDGWSYADIAAELSMSEFSVMNYLHNLGIRKPTKAELRSREMAHA